MLGRGASGKVCYFFFLLKLFFIIFLLKKVFKALNIKTGDFVAIKKIEKHNLDKNEIELAKVINYIIHLFNKKKK